MAAVPDWQVKGSKFDFWYKKQTNKQMNKHNDSQGNNLEENMGIILGFCVLQSATKLPCSKYTCPSIHRNLGFLKIILNKIPSN